MFRVKSIGILLPLLLLVGCNFPLQFLPSSPFAEDAKEGIPTGENAFIRIIDENGAPLASLSIALISYPDTQNTDPLLFSPGNLLDMAVYTAITDSTGTANFEDIQEGKYIILAGWGIGGDDKDRVPLISIDLGTGMLYYPEICIPEQTDTTITLYKALSLKITGDTINPNGVPVLNHPSVDNPIKFSWSDPYNDENAQYALIIWSHSRGIVYYYPTSPDSLIESTQFIFPKTNEENSLLTNGSYRVFIAKVTNPDSINPALFEILTSEPLLGHFIVHGGGNE